MINDEDVHTVTNYVLSDDHGTVSNGTHRCWVQLLIRSLKLIHHRLKPTSFEGFESATFKSVPENKRRSSRYDQGNNNKSGSPTKAADKTKKSFKFRLDISRNWSDILRIDEDSGNTLWKDGAEKEVAALILH